MMQIMTNTLLLLVLVVVSSFSQVQVIKSSRPIQLDGFLPEWKTAEARTFDAHTWLEGDLASTKEGLAGYFRPTRDDSCPLASILLYPDLKKIRYFWRIDMTQDTLPQWVGRVSLGDGVSRHPVVEMVIPWDSLTLDSKGNYLMGVAGFNTCGDTIAAFIIQGQRTIAAPKRVGASQLVLQSVVLLLLLIAYLYLQARVRKKMAQMARPRR